MLAMIINNVNQSKEKKMDIIQIVEFTVNGNTQINLIFLIIFQLFILKWTMIFFLNEAHLII